MRDLQVAAGRLVYLYEVEGNTPEDVNSLPTRQIVADSVTLAPEQEQNLTLVACWAQAQTGKGGLVPCWAQAQAGKGGFVIHKNLMYHKDRVDGQSVCQLSLIHI